jgi:amino acid transporter
MARDGALPGARWLAHVSSKHQAPNRAAILIGLAGCGLLLVNLNFEKIMTALVCVSIVWANLAYLLTNGQLLFGRHGQGRGTRVLAALAVLWSCLLIVNIAWPRTIFYGEEVYQQYAAVLFTAILLLAGVVIYRFAGVTR